MISSRSLSGMFLVIVCMLSITVTNSFAESADIPELLTEISENERRSDSMSALSTQTAYVERSDLVLANVSALNSSQVNITVFNETITLSKDRTEVRDRGGYAWYGTGNATSAILLVDGTTMFGSIHTRDATYLIEFTKMEHVHWLHKMDLSLFPPEYGYAEGETYERTTRSHVSLPELLDINRRSSAYDGAHDYSDNPVTIDVFVGYTDAVFVYLTENETVAHNTIEFSVRLANESYRNNQLPIVLNLVDTMRVSGYNETSIDVDLNNLEDPAQFVDLRREYVRQNADVLLLMTHDGNPSHCGKASRILAADAASSLAIMEISCIVRHTFAHEVGHLQGAGHVRVSSGQDMYINSEFAYGHGFYSIADGTRTIMSYPCPSLTLNECPRQTLWSDPHRNFAGTMTPAGTTDHEWNARVLFATGPYIASFAGGTQEYDNIPPAGIFEWIFAHGKLIIHAIFDEVLHDRYPLTVTITEGTAETVVDMTRINGTHYTHTHTKINDVETIHLSLSNARDVYGNEVVSRPSSGSTIMVSVPDRTDPVITAPAGKTVEAKGYRTPVALGTPVVSDNRDPNPRITNDAPSSFLVKTTTVTWTARDSSGNTATDTQRITVRDTTPPDITAPRDISFTTPDASIALTKSHYGTAIARDLVDSTPIIRNNAPTLFDSGRTTTITWTATDDYRNSATATQRVTVIHSSLEITAPADVTVEATGPTMSVNIGTATATHDTDTNLTISNDAPASFEAGTTTAVTWTVVDSSGVMDTDIQRITVRDTTDPVFDPVTNLDFIFEPDVPLIVNYDLPAATDIADESVAVTCTPASGAVFSEGATEVACTATDDSGNIADVTFNVSVRVFNSTLFLDDFEDGNMDGWTLAGDHELWNAMPLDELAYPPDHPSTNKVAQAVLCEVVCVMSMTGFDLSMQAEPEFLQFYRYFDNTLDDGEYLSLEVYDGASWTELDRWSQENSDDDDVWHLEEYSLSDYTEVTDFGMRFTVYSDAFNEAVGIDDIKLFVVPVEPPTITTPDDVTAEATGLLTAVDIGTATATHDTDTDITILNDAPASFPLGSTTVTWTATSSSNKSATDTQRITVQDTTAPSVTAPPDASFNIIGTSTTLTASDYGTATAVDLVDSTPAIRNDAPSSFALGNTTITWTATDDYGNSDTATQNVMVVLSSLMITPPDDVTAEATGLLTAVDIGDATATHDTDTDITILNDAPASFPLGSTTVTWTATDSSSNVVTDTQTVTVQDTTAPSVTAPPDASFTIIGTSTTLTASDYGTATATDLVDSSPTIGSNAPDLFPLGNTTITWTATDDYGNSAQATQQVTVILSSLMITAPADITVEATGTLTTVDIGNATATHDTDTDITVTNDAPPSFRVGTTTVITWTATDSVNDVVTDTQTITVRDTTAPVFDPVANLDFIFEPDVPLAINYDSPTATDSVNGSVDVTCAPASGTVFNGGTTGVTCTATDDSGNTASLTFSIDVLVLSTTIFLDDFEDGNMNGWTVTDYSDTWDSYTPEGGVNPPDHPATNKVAQVSWCDITCTMSITGFDLSGNAYPEFLQFYRYVDDTLDNGEYLLLEVYDGSSWTELDRWTPEDSDDDDAWHLEEYSLADYTEVTDFGMRFTTVLSSPNEVVGIDDVKIFIVP